MPMMALSWMMLHSKAAYMTASEFDHRRVRRFVADIREEFIYGLLDGHLDDSCAFEPRCLIRSSLVGARRRHADSSAATTALREASRKRTDVLPARPHAPGAGLKTFGARWTSTS